jgi:hypothetical protein
MADVYDSIRDMLNGSSPDLDFVVEVLLRLIRSCSTAEQVAKLGKRDVPVLVNEMLALDVLKEDLEASRLGVKAVIKLCRREMEKDTADWNNCDKFEKTSVFTNLMNIWRCNEKDADLAEQLCWCFAVLASDCNSRQQKLAQAGAPDVLVKIIKNFKENASVCKMACRAVRNLSIMEETSAELMKEGIAEAIFEIFTHHSTNDSVMECVAWALVNLSCDSSMATILGANRCCSSAVVALVSWKARTIAAKETPLGEGLVFGFSQSKPSGFKAAVALLWAIRNLSCSSTYNLPILANTDICQTMMDTVKIFIDVGDYEATSIGLFCLGNLACHPEMAKRLMALDTYEVIQKAVDAVLPALKSKFKMVRSTHEKIYDIYEEKEAQVINAVMSAIRNLGSNVGSLQSELIEIGVHSLLLNLLELMYEEESFAEVGCGGLVNLMTENPSCRSDLGKKGLCELIVKILNKYTSREPIGEMACKVVMSLTMGGSEQKDNRSRLHAANFMQAVTNTMQNLRYSEPVVRSACDALLHGHFLGYDDNVTTDNIDNADGDNIKVESELAYLREKGAVDDHDRAFINDWTFDEVKDVWFTDSVVEIVGPPRPTTAIERKAAIDAAKINGDEIETKVKGETDS